MTAIRDRFFITYQRYTFTTYQRECDLVSEFNPNAQLTTTLHTNRPMKAIPIPNTPTPPTANSVIGHSPSPPPTPGLEDIEYKVDDHLKIGRRIRSSTIDIGYIPTKKLEFAEWIIEVKMVIQRKCLDLLLLWIHNYWIEDFDPMHQTQNEEVIQILTQFIKDIKKSRDQFQNLSQPKKSKKKV